MKKTDLIGMSVRNLLRRKFRTLLTVMGVVIGATSIILMLSLGLAMDKNMEEQMASMGDLTQIRVNSYGGGNNGQVIDDKTIREFEKLEHVERAIPLINDLSIHFIKDKYRTCYEQQVYVFSAEDIEALGYEVDQGRNLLEDETKSIIVGPRLFMYMTKKGKEIDWSKGEPTPMDFNMDTDTLTLSVLQYDWETGKPQLEGQEGKVKRPKEYDVSVVGMFGEENHELANMIIIPKKLYEVLKKESIAYRKALGYYSKEDKEKDKKLTYNEVIVKVDDKDHVVATLDALKAEGYDAWNDMEYLEDMQKQSKSRQMALGAIGIVSFVVAAIGIANTMMMSIYERTKEIGVMKVIGAKVKDIKYMFLMESLLIGLFGGLMGALISFILSLIMNASGEKIAEIVGLYGTSTVSVMPPALLMIGILFSVVVGLLSGYFPARKATKLSALSAIRTD